MYIYVCVCVCVCVFVCVCVCVCVCKYTRKEPGPSTDSWLHFNVLRGEILSNQFRGDVWSACRVPSRCCFLDKDYRYK